MKSLLKRPFAFWLPAFFCLFLLWTWVISCYQSIRITHWNQGYQRGQSNLLTTGESRLVFVFTRTRGDYLGTPTSDFRYFREEIPVTHSYWWFPLPGFEHRDQSIPGIQSHFYCLVIPYWLIILLYLGLWRFALRRHDRRHARSREAHGLPAAHQQAD